MICHKICTTHGYAGLQINQQKQNVTPLRRVLKNKLKLKTSKHIILHSMFNLQLSSIFYSYYIFCPLRRRDEFRIFGILDPCVRES